MDRRPADISDQIVVRPPTRADVPALDDLFEAVKSRRWPEGYVKWHLFDTPLGDAPAHAAFLGELCIGLYVMLPSALRLGRETVTAVQAMDVMVHPQYRLQGVFAQLADETVREAEGRGFEVAYGFPNEVSFPIYIRYRNAHHVGDVVSYAAYTRMPSWRRSVAKKPELGRLDLEVARPPDVELGELVARLHDEPDVCRIEKSIAYLDWRYGGPTGDTYEWLTLRERSGAAVASALVGDRAPAWESGSTFVARVHELFAGEAEHASLLMRLALGRGARRGVEKVQVLVKDPIVETALRLTPFRPESAVHFSVRKLTTRLQGGNIHHFPFWRVISGDMDVY